MGMTNQGHLANPVGMTMTTMMMMMMMMHQDQAADHQGMTMMMKNSTVVDVKERKEERKEVISQSQAANPQRMVMIENQNQVANHQSPMRKKIVC